MVSFSLEYKTLLIQTKNQLLEQKTTTVLRVMGHLEMEVK